MFENRQSPEIWAIDDPISRMGAAIYASLVENHNGVKHNRDVNFREANLGNVLNAFSGLYLLNLYYHERSSIELRKQGFFKPLEETAVSLKLHLDLFRIDSAWLNV